MSDMKVITVCARFRVTVRCLTGRKTTTRVNVPLWYVNNIEKLRPWLEQHFAPAAVLNWEDIKQQREEFRKSLNQIGDGEGTQVTIHRTIGNISRKIKGKRFSSFQATVMFSEVEHNVAHPEF
jgi:hypothetical protein